MKKLRSAVVVLVCLALAAFMAACSTSSSKPHVTYLHAGMVFDGVRLPPHWPTMPNTPTKPVTGPPGQGVIVPTRTDNSPPGYAGYVVPSDTSASPSSTPSIVATLTVPHLNGTYCKMHPGATVAMWIGFGGNAFFNLLGDGSPASPMVTQVGVTAKCSSGHTSPDNATYQAWYEDIGSSPPVPKDQYAQYMGPVTDFSSGIHAGDTIYLGMIQHGGCKQAGPLGLERVCLKDSYDIYEVTDATTGVQLLNQPHAELPAAFVNKGFDDSSAEAIVEDMSDNGTPEPYADYTPVSFSNVYMTGSNGQQEELTPSISGLLQVIFNNGLRNALWPNGGPGTWSARPAFYPGPDGQAFLVTETQLKPIPVVPTPQPNPGMNPPQDAIDAWEATENDASNIVGNALNGVGSLLPSSDGTQIAELHQLATIPLGGGLSEDPPTQASEGKADITALDNFFGTPGLMPGEGSDTGTAPAPPPPTTPPPTTTATPGYGSPEDAVDGFYQGELAGDWAAVCSYVTPSAQAPCLAGTSGQGAATGQVTVGQAMISDNEALVSVTGSICAPSSPCVTNSDPSLGMPPSLSQFPADYQTAVANSTSGSTTVISPMPCSQINGKWYVNFG